MLNLVKAELFKYSRRPFIYIINIFLIVFIMTIPLWKYLLGVDGVYRENIIDGLGTSFNLILMLLVLFSVIMLDDFREGTYKNLIVSNISKTEIYIGKFIVQIVLALITTIVCIITFSIVMLFFKSNGTMDSTILNVATRFLCAIPMYLAGIALLDVLIVIIKKGNVYVIYYLIIKIVPMAIAAAQSLVWDKFKYVNDVLMNTILNNLSVSNATSTDLLMSVVCGTIYTVIFLIIGTTIFNKQEIK